MNIAHLLPASAVFPLEKHNGRYEWVLRLARAQVRDGHQVTIYAGPDSYDDSALRWKSVETISDTDTRTRNTALIRSAFEAQHELYHSHFDSLHCTIVDETKAPIVATQHWFPTRAIADEIRLDIAHHVATVPVTEHMRTADVELGITPSEVIYHGIDLSLFRYIQQPRNDRLIFVGRITPMKGVLEAVKYAIAAKVGLDIVGKINDSDRSYWDSISPFVDGTQIRYLGQKNQSEVATLMQCAQACIFVSQTPEAFGQTIIEAQACGTPVIISYVGASNELVKDKETGFICNTDEQYLTAIRNVKLLKPLTCRKNAQRFDFNAMHKNYLSLYTALLKNKITR